MAKKDKSTFLFKNNIQQYMNSVAKEDDVIREKMESSDKNIDDCVQFILNTVKSSGKFGFTNDEIYGLALHYYDEDEIDIGAKIRVPKIIINEEVHLTDEEIAQAKQKAIDDVYNEQRNKMTNKPKEAKKSDDKKPEDTGTLF